MIALGLAAGLLLLPAAPGEARRSAQAQAARPSQNDVMATLLATMLDNPALAGDQVGFVLLDRTGKVRFARNADRRFVPASVRKLLVTAAALDLLGPEASFSTRVHAAGDLVGDRLLGDLVLAGGGDPALDSGGLDDLAGQVASAGIRQVSGAVLVDTSRFRPAEDYGTGWPYDDEPFAYASRIAALVVDRNAASGSAASRHPSLHALERFGASLRARGVEFEGPYGEGPVPSDARLIARRDSPPVRDLLALTNKPSDNLFAEILLRQLAALATPDATASTARLALEAEAAWLGWPRDQYRLVDGSGLSRYDLLTPRQLADVLLRMKDRPEFVASLPVAGIDGTLRDRLAGTRGQGQIRAKTGTMSGISTLAGYAGDRYIFAFMVNGHVGSIAPVRAIQDAICLALSDATPSAAY